MVAAAVYAAATAPVFLGADVGSLIAAFVREPSSPPLMLMIWAAAVAAGLVLLVVGLRAVMIDLDDVPVWPWVSGAAVAVVVLWQDWTLPRALGPLFVAGSRGVCWSVIAAAAVNLWLATSMRFWWRGFFAGEADARGGGDSGELMQAHDTIEQLMTERDELRAKLARVASPADLTRFVDILGGRRAVLAWLHPDGKPEAEKRAATARFQQAGEILARIDGARR